MFGYCVSVILDVGSKRRFMLTAFNSVVFMFSIYFFCHIFFVSNNVFTIFDLSNNLYTMKFKLESLLRENEVLSRGIVALNSDNPDIDFIDEKMRDMLGYISDNEKFINIEDLNECIHLNVEQKGD